MDRRVGVDVAAVLARRRGRRRRDLPAPRIVGARETSASSRAREPRVTSFALRALGRVESTQRLDEPGDVIFLGAVVLVAVTYGRRRARVVDLVVGAGADAEAPGDPYR